MLQGYQIQPNKRNIHFIFSQLQFNNISTNNYNMQHIIEILEYPLISNPSELQGLVSNSHM